MLVVCMPSQWLTCNVNEPAYLLVSMLVVHHYNNYYLFCLEFLSSEKSQSPPKTLSKEKSIRCESHVPRFDNLGHIVLHLSIQE